MAALRAAIRDSDAVLIASPEYNFSISGVLKNAIDWASRVPDQPFDGKPVAIIGAATGLYGTARSQYELRKILASLNAHLLNKPEVLISQAATKFDAEGRLTDETARGLLSQKMAALRNWALNLGAEIAADGIHVGHVAIGVWMTDRAPEGVAALPPAQIAPTYWDLHTQRNTHEVIVTA